MLDLEWRGIFQPLKKLPQLPASRTLAAASLLVLASGAAVAGASLAAAREHRAREPRALSHADRRLAAENRNYLDRAATLKVLGADDVLNASYAMEGQRVELLMTFYRTQMGGKGGVHSPEVCLPAGGWEVSQWARKAVASR